MSAALKPFASDDRIELRRRLEARAERLRSEMAGAIRESIEGTPEGDPARDVRVSELERDARELESVLDALARLDTPAFGRCAICGELIGRARLFAQPDASLCAPCARRREEEAGASPANL